MFSCRGPRRYPRTNAAFSDQAPSIFWGCFAWRRRRTGNSELRNVVSGGQLNPQGRFRREFGTVAQQPGSHIACGNPDRGILASVKRRLPPEDFDSQLTLGQEFKLSIQDLADNEGQEPLAADASAEGRTG